MVVVVFIRAMYSRAHMESATDMIALVSTLCGQLCLLQSLTTFLKFGHAHTHEVS